MNGTLHPVVDRIGFYYIPNTDNYAIDQNGSVIDDKGNVVPSFKHYTNGRRAVVVLDGGERRTRCVDYLLGLTFILLPKHLDYESSRIHHLDHDEHNDSLHNLIWVKRQYKLISKVVERERFFREKYDYPNFTAENDGLYPNAVECVKHKPGYYYIPGIAIPVVINKDGKIFDLTKNEHLEPYDNLGYRTINLKYEDKWKIVLVHRIVARMFVGKPERHRHLDIKYLEVNHKDGTKSNNVASNLEWVTPSENLIHAHRTGLAVAPNLGSGNKNRLKRKDFDILAKDIRSGEIKRYDTIAGVCKAHGLNDQLIVVRLNNGQAMIKTKDWHVFKYDDGTDWPELKDYQKVPNRWQISGSAWYATKEGQPVLYGAKASDIEGALGWRQGRIGVQFARNGKDALIDGWKITDDPDPSVELAEKLNLSKTGMRESVKISVRPTICLPSTQATLFDSLSAAAKEAGLSTTTIAAQLRKNGTKPFDLGGYTFQSVA